MRRGEYSFRSRPQFAWWHVLRAPQPGLLSWRGWLPFPPALGRLMPALAVVGRVRGKAVRFRRGRAAVMDEFTPAELTVPQPLPASPVGRWSHVGRALPVTMFGGQCPPYTS